MIWVFMFILFLPFFIVFYSVKNIGLVDTYNGLQKTGYDIDTYSRVLKICKHIADKTTLALKDLKYIDKRKTVIYTCDDKRVIDFAADGAVSLIERIQKIEKKCSDIVNINLDKKEQVKKIVNEFQNKSDTEIIKYFISEKDMKYFQDLNYTKQYIKGKINETK